MSEIKVGEYVRTIFGKILQITSLRDMGYIEKGNPYFRQQIKKHSPNIIGLIEERRLCERKTNSLCIRKSKKRRNYNLLW